MILDHQNNNNKNDDDDEKLRNIYLLTLNIRVKEKKTLVISLLNFHYF